MEPQTRFNLDQAVAAWRAELASHPGPAPEDLRTLEAHLRDGFAALQGGQLSDEEAFHIASRRVGPPEPVADEFAKAAPARVWRSRVFWLVFGVLAYDAFGAVYGLMIIFAQNGFSSFEVPNPNAQANSGWMMYAPIFLFGITRYILVSLCLVVGVPRSVAQLLRTRLRVIMLGTSLLLLEACAHILSSRSLGVDAAATAFDTRFYYRPLCLLVLAVCLAPHQIISTPATTANWRRRVFWLILGIFSTTGYMPLAQIFSWLRGKIDNLFAPMGVSSAPEWVGVLNQLCSQMPFIIVLFIAGLWLARGVPKFVSRLLATRVQVAMVTGGLFLLANQDIIYWLKKIFWFPHGPDGEHFNGSLFFSQVFLMAVLVWLTPPRVQAPIETKTAVA